jgi:hypothetical protein
MSFGATLGSHDYLNYDQPIGIQLHYDDPSGGPAELELYDCGSSTSATDCTKQTNAQLNYGTLEVEMKAPRNENACDWHVRSAYKHMLYLLDPTQASNSKIGFIDVPYKFDDMGVPQYEPDCYDCDEQNPNYGSKCPLEKPVYDSTLSASGREIHESMSDVNVKKELDAILVGLNKFPVKDKRLLIAELTHIQSSLSGKYKDQDVDLLPTFSQLETLGYLLPNSADALNTDVENLENAEVKVQSSNLNVEGFEATLFNEQKLAAYVRYLDTTKDGKDCRAPITQLQ